MSFSGRNAPSPSGWSLPKSEKNVTSWHSPPLCSHPTLFANIPVSYERIHLASLCCADVYLSSSDSQHSCFIFVGTHLSHADSNLFRHTWFPYFSRRCFIRLILISRLYYVTLEWGGKFSSFLVGGFRVRVKAAINVPLRTTFLNTFNCYELSKTSFVKRVCQEWNSCRACHHHITDGRFILNPRRNC